MQNTECVWRASLILYAVFEMLDEFAHVPTVEIVIQIKWEFNIKLFIYGRVSTRPQQQFCDKYQWYGHRVS